MAAYRARAEKEIRLVLIGKTGVGKSVTGNSILGEELFKPVHGLNSGTEKCDWNYVCRNGFRIKVTDTPGVCDTHRTKADVHREIAKCVATCSPGPHAIVMVLNAKARFTEEETAAYTELKRLFGDDIIHFMVAVFTGGDEIDEMTLKEQLAEARPTARQIVKDASGRYVIFDNHRKTPWEERRQQGDKLIEVVCHMMLQNSNGYYTNDLTKRVEVLIEAEENTGTTRAELSRQIVEEERLGFVMRIVRSIGGFLGNRCLIM